MYPVDLCLDVRMANRTESRWSSQSFWCKALGLINKIVTGPLWRVIESKDISILDMNVRYRHLLECFEKINGQMMPQKLFQV